MSEPLARWHEEHVRFARILDVLELQLQAFHAGEDPDYLLMRDIVRSLHEYGHRFHHPREDLAFARMAEKEPEIRVVANRLQQEHRVIAWAGEELASQLDQISEDVIVERAAVEAAASTYLVYYRHHLRTEERDILPRAARLLAPEDWEAVAKAVPPADTTGGRDASGWYEAVLGRIGDTQTP